MSNNNPMQVVTGQARLSYVHLFTPYASPNGGDPKYSVTVLIPKSDVATKQRIDAAIQSAIQSGVESRWNGVRPPLIALPIHDGDGVRPSDGMPFGDECKGHWVFTASAKQAPGVVDVALNPILNQTEIYSGIYGRVSVRFFPYANSGKKGIGVGLNNVQKLADGEPLGSRTTAADDFGGEPLGAYAPSTPQAYGVPGQPQQPQYQVPQQPQYQVPQPPQYQPPQYQPPQQPPQQQIDPITGMPVGGVMGI